MTELHSGVLPLFVLAFTLFILIISILLDFENKAINWIMISFGVVIAIYTFYERYYFFTHVKLI